MTRNITSIYQGYPTRDWLK